MKKIEYAEQLKVSEEKVSVLSKTEDFTLPEFSKEVPISSKAHPTSQETTVDYQWQKTDSKMFRVKRITFRKGESLSGFCKAQVEDGVDSFSVVYNGVNYIFRKTHKEVALSLYASYTKLQTLVENIVGYLKSVLGFDYIISKLDSDGWTFDERLRNSQITLLNTSELNSSSKNNLVEKITEKISELHSNYLILGKFTINHILLSNDKLFFTDLRKLRESRQRSFVVDELRQILAYLFSIGLASREDVYYSIAYYVAKNPVLCDEWYSEKTKKRPKDSFEVASKIEDLVYT